MLTPFDEELVVGSRFADRFQILGVVGRGSMGVVYQARHELMGRMVAIKMLRGQLQMDERTLRRFEREARAASRFDHANLISVHDFGVTAQRQPYLVMDFVQGHTLYEIQRSEDHITPDRAVRIFTQVCDALHHAHLQGVIHRDLKPSNIMLVHKDNEADFVKVFDMGIAKIAWGEDEDKEPLTNTGEVCGSPIYLSPEQCTHQPLDARTDIYSLGVVMYELLTGVPPLMGHTVYDTIYMHVHEIPKPFAEVRPDLAIPNRLERIVFKALEKNPDDRYQSMQELKWEIQASLQESDPHLRVLPPEALLGKRRRPTDQPAHGADKTALVKDPNGRISNPAGPGMPAGQLTPGAMSSGGMSSMSSGAMGSMTPGTMGSMTPGAMGSMTPGAMGSMTPPNVMPPGGMTPGPMAPGPMTPGMPTQVKPPATQNLSLKQSIEMRSLAAGAANGSRNGSQPEGGTNAAKIAVISSAVSVLLTLCGVGAWYVLNHKVTPANQTQGTVGSAVDGGYEGSTDQQGNSGSDPLSQSAISTPQEHDYQPMIGFRRRQQKQNSAAPSTQAHSTVSTTPTTTAVSSPYASSPSRPKQSAKAAERERKAKPTAVAQSQPQSASPAAASAPTQKNWFLSLFQPGNSTKNGQNAANQQAQQQHGQQQHGQQQQVQPAQQVAQQPQGLFGQQPQMQQPQAGMPSPAQMMPHNHAGNQQLLAAHQGNTNPQQQQMWGQQNQAPHQQQMWGQQPNQQAHQQQMWQQQQAAMQQQQQQMQQAAMQQQMLQQQMQQQQQQMQQQQQAQQPQPQQQGASPQLHTQAVSLNNAGVQLLGDNPARAIEKFKEALQLDPNYQTASKNLGRAYHNNANKLRNAGDNAGADFNYRMSIRLLSQTLGNDHQDTRIAREDYDSFLAQTKAN